MTVLQRIRPSIVGLLSVLLALFLIVGQLGAASALPRQTEGPLILPGTDGEPSTGTVTVHKYEQGDLWGVPSNGAVMDVDGTPIAGVTFEAQQIEAITVGTTEYDLDLSTIDGWQHASKLVLDDGAWLYDGAAATVQLGTTYTANTGATTYSPAVFQDLPIGLYLFTETKAPIGVTKSEDWVLSVPLTDPVERTSWLYDINVYPKNGVSDISKTVNDADAAKVGDTVEWTIIGDIPLDANPDYSQYRDVSETNLKFLPPTAYVVEDQLDDRLKPVSADPTVVTLTSGGIELAVGTDYTVTAEQTAGSKVTVTFTEEGRAKMALAASKASSATAVDVQIVLTTEVVTLNSPQSLKGTIGDGLIDNQALLFPNSESIEWEMPVPSNIPETRWGDLVIEKISSTNHQAGLSGATFQLFETKADAEKGTNVIAIDGVSEFTTGNDGIVRISGLRASDFENGNPILDENDWQYYWIVETKAPQGYELQAEPIRVAVTGASTSALVIPVENNPHNADFLLPHTGASGTWMFTIGGLVLLGGGVILAVRRKVDTKSGD